MKFESPDEALRALSVELQTVGIEPLETHHTGRILANPVVADRDSPAADVSAMDGYAVRLTHVESKQVLPVVGESIAGSPAPEMPDEGVIRIFTGAIVPAGSDAVIKREDTEEFETEIRLRAETGTLSQGQHIRRAGENAVKGCTVLERGIEITAAHKATMANFGCSATDVYKPVRVTILTTGDEVDNFHDEAPLPWQLRNSNRESIATLLSSKPWISVVSVEHCVDDRDLLRDTLARCLQTSDAILMTGGVSMGDYDYVPDVIQEIGGKVIFHGLPIRPGKPVLGAATETGKLLMGLPGNPVSATIGCQRLAIPLLAHMAGKKSWLPYVAKVQIQNSGNQTIALHWLRLVRLTSHGVAEPVISQGSGDLVSLGNSDGFVEIPSGLGGEGPWPYYSW